MRNFLNFAPGAMTHAKCKSVIPAINQRFRNKASATFFRVTHFSLRQMTWAGTVHTHTYSPQSLCAARTNCAAILSQNRETRAKPSAWETVAADFPVPYEILASHFQVICLSLFNFENDIRHFKM